MDKILQALGLGGAKPEYAEKIPESLTERDFSLNSVSQLASLLCLIDLAQTS